MSATLAQLLRVQSQLAKDAEQFLSELATALDPTLWEFGGERLRASDVFVEPVVLLSSTPNLGNGRSGRDEREGKGEGETRPKVRDEPAGWSVALMDEALPKLYERDRSAERNEEQRWWKVVDARRRLRLAVVGEPGSGKTVSTRHTVVRLARQGEAALSGHLRDIEAIMFPWWITAERLLDQPEDASTADAVLGALSPAMAGALSPRLHEWLRRRVLGRKMLIVVDALDELREPEDEMARRFDRFEARMAELGRSEASVIVTCRTLQWRRLQQRLVPWQNARDTVEMKPLDRREQREYARQFFAFVKQPGLMREFEDRVESQVSLHEHCRTPLILTFACGLLADGRLPSDATIAVLYRLVVGRLLNGAWRNSAGVPAWTQVKAQREGVKLFLGPLTWRLFVHSPKTNHFALGAWDEAWASASVLSKPPQIHSELLLEDLMRVGLLVDGGTDEKGDESWSFAHRTLLEFLAADGLHRDEAKSHWLLHERKEPGRDPFDFRPEWVPMLTFLAAIMGDASRLIAAVDLPPLGAKNTRAEDDFFSQRFGLKCRFAGAAPKTPSLLIERLGKEWLRGWKATDRLLFAGLRRLWESYGRALATHPAFHPAILGPMLPSLSENSDRGHQSVVLKERVAAAFPKRFRRLISFLSECLGEERKTFLRAKKMPIVEKVMIFKEPRLVAPLVACLESEKDDLLRAKIALALGQFKDRTAVPGLLRQLERESIGTIRGDIATALGMLGESAAIGHLVSLLEVEEYWLIAHQAQGFTINGINERGEIGPTLARFENRQYQPEPGRRLTVRGQPKDYTAAGPFLVMAEGLNLDLNISWWGTLAHESPEKRYKYLFKEDDEVRGKAARALGALFDRAAVEPLRAALRRETEWTVRKTIIAALGSLGDSTAFGWLLGLLRSEEATHRAHAAECLMELGDIDAVDPLLEQLRIESDARVVCAIAGALAKLGDRSAVEPLMAALNNRNPGKIALALGTFKDPAALLPLLSCYDHCKERSRNAWNAHVWETDCREVIESIGILGDQRAVSHLLEWLEHEKDDSRIGSIATALGALGDKAAVEHLLVHLDNAQWHDNSLSIDPIVRALGALGAASAVKPLWCWLDPRRWSNVEATEALWRIHQATGTVIPGSIANGICSTFKSIRVLKGRSERRWIELDRSYAALKFNSATAPAESER